MIYRIESFDLWLPPEGRKKSSCTLSCRLVVLSSAWISLGVPLLASVRFVCSEGSAARCPEGWGRWPGCVQTNFGCACASLYGHSKSNVSWMTRLTGRALASCTVCLCVVLYGILCERTTRISSGLQWLLKHICVPTASDLSWQIVIYLAQLASLKHFVVLEWLRNEH